jgi:hypothetical protein
MVIHNSYVLTSVLIYATHLIAFFTTNVQMTTIIRLFPRSLKLHSASASSLINIAPDIVLARVLKITFRQDGGFAHSPCLVVCKVRSDIFYIRFLGLKRRILKVLSEKAKNYLTWAFFVAP